MEIIKGIAVSKGLRIGKAFVWKGNELPEVPRYTLLRRADSEEHWERFNLAVEKAVNCRKMALENADTQPDGTESTILNAQILMLEDVELREQAYMRVFEKKENIEWAVYDISCQMAQTLMKLPDDYLRERAADISDISREIIYNLLGIERQTLSRLDEDVIIVAHDLLPSHAIAMDKKHILGIALDMGSATCHTAILARSFEIPAVLALGCISRKVMDGSTLILNAVSGEVIIQPGDTALELYKKTIHEQEKEHGELEFLDNLESKTQDGVHITLKANIELPGETAKAYTYGAEGIGLFRSEFLFLKPSAPANEDAQYQAYSDVIKASGGKPVTIRTIDVGGDKILPNLYADEEKNPLLGWRAIRFSLAAPELFKTQLRAILRASAHGELKIMFPLISSLGELLEARRLLSEAKSECGARGYEFDPKIKTGTMIEVPSAALIAGTLAKYADFFSLGTNDLAQYTLAVDRGNEKVGYLGDPCHPAVLRLIKMTADAAQNAGICVSICGQIGGDPVLTPLLVGLGVKELSMDAVSILQVKAAVRAVSTVRCRELAEKALKCETADAVRRILKEEQKNAGLV
ncbi:MAG: phosphoenolpyruvate--protein phosphotransferase [Spirochaetaceae bacterium]|jgi:phosphotransferase system enzyme I (PtsI)|nr:phosphoenolpyruvate--protein phosphotransferase [Spirochaetaceae bacterium]